MKRNIMNRRVINDLKTRSSIGILIYMILAFIVIFENGYNLRNPVFSWTFFTLLNGVCLLRIIHLWFFKIFEQYNESLNTDVFVGLVLTTASIWGGSFAYSMYQNGEHTAKLLMAICTAGLASGGVVAFIPHRLLAIIFNLFMLFPAIVLMSVKGDNPSLVLMIFLFSIYLILLTLRGSREYWDALETEAKLKEKTVELKRLSHTDPLTGLYNRRYFNEIFDFEWKRASRDKTALTVVMCDIDYFKKVNDTLGHIAGDDYLISITRVLKNKFKRDTDIVARFGGEEFVILLSGLDEDDAFQMAEFLRKQAMDHIVMYDGSEIKTTLSFGIASCVPSAHGSPDHLLGRADRALYRAKDNGRNRVEIDAPSLARG